MRAAIFRNGEIVVDSLPEPEPAAGQVLVRTLACGICGSDLHARKHAHRMVEMARHFPGRKPMDLARDVVFGHEFACEILDHGPGPARGLKAGTRVCSIPALLTPEGPKGIGYIPTTMSAAMPSACCSARRCCWRSPMDWRPNMPH
jgi:threonine dehydrogenase-like Zn-dependent dehydrogenase